MSSKETIISRRGLLTGLLASSLVIGATPALSDTPFTSFSFPATGAPGNRTDPDRWGKDIVNVIDWNADRTGTFDSTAAILAAIDYASALGAAFNHGAIVFFPPGKYLTAAALNNARVVGTVSLVGGDRNGTVISGTFAGYIIDQDDGQTGQIERIANLTVINGYISSGYDATVGGIRFNNNSDGIIANCNAQGRTGIALYSNCFNTIVSACSVTGFRGLGCVGYVGIAHFDSCDATGIWVGFQIFGGNTCVLTSCRCENTETAVVIGRDQNNSINNSKGCVIDSFQTERCYKGIECCSWNELTLNSAYITGTIGPANPVSSIAWSGGTATVTVSGISLDDIGWTSGTRSTTIEQNNGAGPWDQGDVWVTGTRTSATTFTYPLAVNPGSYPGSGQPAAVWSTKQLYAFAVTGGGYGLVMNGCACEIAGGNLAIAAGGAGFDLHNGNTDIGQHIVLNGCRAGDAGWNAPRSTSKAAVTYINCDNPGGATADNLGNQFGMNFADLPGQSGVTYTTALEGMQYYIVNSNQTTLGSTAAAGGSTHGYVVYNGTNWTQATK